MLPGIFEDRRKRLEDVLQSELQVSVRVGNGRVDEAVGAAREGRGRVGGMEAIGDVIGFNPSFNLMRLANLEGSGEGAIPLPGRWSLNIVRPWLASTPLAGTVKFTGGARY